MKQENEGPQPVRERVNDFWLRVGGITALNIFLNIFFYLHLSQEKNIPFWKIFLLSTFFVFLSWEVTRWVVLQVRKRFPGLQNMRTRIIRLTIYVTLATVALSIFKVWFQDAIEFYGEMNSGIFDYFYGFGMNMFYALVITGIYESLYYFHQWQRLLAETELLKQANLQSQFDSLKNQVNPHFLFNSLNSLSSLVEEDKEQAVSFIAELSSVYRYLLQSNERELTTLQSELDFIKAYFFLLRTRFRQGVDLLIEVPDGMRERLLPPLTLQMLVENAVKHNVISVSRPLLVRITATADGWLHVVNNLQRKIQQVPGSGLGLVNITEKFRLLKQPQPQINETATEFRVSIPLMDSRMPYRPFAGSAENVSLAS